MRRCTHWLREDLGSRPDRPDFVPPSPFLVVKDPLTEASGNLILLMLSVVRPGCRFFCRSGHPVITVDQFFGFRVSSFASGASV